MLSGFAGAAPPHAARVLPACSVKSHDVCNSVASRLIDQLAINNAGLGSFPSMTASMASIVSGRK